MSLRRLALVLVALAVFAAPASAAGAPQVIDGCGDAGTTGSFNDDSVELEENREYLDLKSGQVSGLYGSGGGFNGFTATLELCGAPSADDGGYSLGWGYGERCYGSVSWTLQGRDEASEGGLAGSIQQAAGRQAVVQEKCYHEQETPLDSGVETIYRVVLPEEAVAFDGNTITFSVTRDLLPAAADRRFAAGTEWQHIGAAAMDQAGSGWAGYGDTEGNRGNLLVRTDFAWSENSYVVGSDAAR